MSTLQTVFVWGGAAVVGGWLILSDDPALPTDPEAAGINLFFIRNFPEWRAADCEDGTVDGQHFINCRPHGSEAPGALFLLEPGKAVAMNGKAIQWSGRGRATYEDGRPFPVERWSGDVVDVSAVIDELR